MSFGSATLKGISFLFKLFLKVAKFTGLIWFVSYMIFFGVIDSVTGGFTSTFIGDIITQAVFVLVLILMCLTTFQNLYRMFRKDGSFNVYKAIYNLALGKRKNIGTVAKTSKDNLVAENDVHGIVFGKVKDKYMIKGENVLGPTFLLGASRSGKGASVLVPTLKSWKGSAFVIDMKGELYNLTSKDRGVEKGKVKKFNPTDPTAFGYDPYYPLRESRNIVQEVKNIALSIIPPTDSGDQKFWVESAQEFLSGGILFYFDMGLSFAQTMIELKSMPPKETVLYIMKSENSKAKIKMSQFVDLDEKTLGGIFGEVSRNIDIFASDDDLINALDGKRACISPLDLEDGFDIYCCIEEHLLDQWRPLMTMICNQMIKFCEQRPIGQDGKPTGRPILLLLDEFPRLGKVTSIVNGIGTLSGRNVHIILAVQSRSNLYDIYGKDKANVIMDNCSYKILILVNDPDTQEWCSKLIGKYDKEKKSSNYNSDIFGMGKGTGSGLSTEQRFILEPDYFGKLSLNKKVIVITPWGYKELEKIEYWNDPAFMDKTKKENK